MGAYEFNQAVIKKHREAMAEKADWDQQTDDSRAAHLWNIMESVRELATLGTDLVVIDKKNFMPWNG